MEKKNIAKDDEIELIPKSKKNNLAKFYDQFIGEDTMDKQTGKKKTQQQNQKNIESIKNIMYGSGDTKPEQINRDTLKSVDDCTEKYIIYLVEQALQRSKMVNPESNEVQLQDLLNILQSDVKKYTYLGQLFYAKRAAKNINDQIKAKTYIDNE